MNQEDLNKNKLYKHLVKCSNRYSKNDYKGLKIILKLWDLCAVLTIGIFLKLNEDGGK